MSFGASYDKTTKVISAAVFIIFVMIAVVTRSVIAEGVFALLFAAAYAWSPTGYEIDGHEVVIRRLIGNIRIPVSGIREVRFATRDDLSGNMRLFGSGGLFGYYGLFRNSGLGTSHWYVTDRSRAVVLFGDSGPVLVSPDNVAGFVTALGKPVATSRPDSQVMASVAIGWMRVAAPVIVAVVAAFIVVSAMVYSPGPPEYTLTRNSLTIHDRFYPVTLSAGGVDLAKLRLIDLDRDPDWQPVTRTDGFGNAHYHSGWFKVSSGRIVRMYRADSRKLVLLPAKGDGSPVLLETKEPEKFVAEVRQEWQ